MSTLAAARADNFYFDPAKFDPSKKGRGTANGIANSLGALGERAKRLKSEGILVIRFELPHDSWCLGCNAHIGRGVRYNADKKQIGMYYTTPLWEFRMTCARCSHPFVIRTDPKGGDYEFVSGIKRKTNTFDPADAGLTGLLGPSEQQRAALDSGDTLYRLEHAETDRRHAAGMAARLQALAAEQDARYADDYASNARLRDGARAARHEDARRLADGAAAGLPGLPLLPASEEDAATARLVMLARRMDRLEQQSQRSPPRMDRLEQAGVAYDSSANKPSHNSLPVPSFSSSSSFAHRVVGGGGGSAVLAATAALKVASETSAAAVSRLLALAAPAAAGAAPASAPIIGLRGASSSSSSSVGSAAYLLSAPGSSIAEGRRRSDGASAWGSHDATDDVGDADSLHVARSAFDGAAGGGLDDADSPAMLRAATSRALSSAGGTPRGAGSVSGGGSSARYHAPVAHACWASGGGLGLNRPSSSAAGSSTNAAAAAAAQLCKGLKRRRAAESALAKVARARMEPSAVVRASTPTAAAAALAAAFAREGGGGGGGSLWSAAAAGGEAAGRAAAAAVRAHRIAAAGASR